MFENNDEEKLLLKKGVNRMKHISTIYNRKLVKGFGSSFKRRLPIFFKMISDRHSLENIICLGAACQIQQIVLTENSIESIVEENIQSLIF